MKKFLTIRWILLGMALLAIVSLTGMNVYSLYALHESTLSATADRQKTQLSDFSFTTRNRFRGPVEGFWKLNMEQIQEELGSRAELSPALAEVLLSAINDPLFDNVHFAHADFESCATPGSVWQFSPATMNLIQTDNPPAYVCEGLGLARTRISVLLSDYRWSTNVVFDTHRSMTVMLINPRASEIVGFFNFSINKEYLVNDFFASQLDETFGSREDTGMTIWLHDWLKNEVLATNDNSLPYDRRSIQYIQRFPDMLDNWNMKVVFDESPAVIASLSNLYRNLMVMGGAVVLLLGSLGIMFIIAQRERRLMERQAGFLANVTHELKTPLAVMQAAGENLADGRVTDPHRLKTYGEHIHTESLRLRRMIEKLLDVARNDAGQHVIKPVAANLDTLLNAYLQEHLPLIKSAGFDPELQIADNLPQVLVDKDSFETILGNLVENAIKYSGESRYLGLRLHHDNHYVTLEVADHGLGIPKHARKHIFDKFYRVEDTLTARTKGHGLGLSIVKSLVELNNAVINVESTYRKGSVFSVKFPLFVLSNQPETQPLNTPKVEYAS